MQSIDDLAMPFLLTSAFQGLVDAVHAELAERGFPGIRAHHGFAMQAISRLSAAGQSCTAVELAQQLGVSKQAATKTAASLVALGLVDRRTNAHDRRERALVITTRGRRMLELSAQGFRRELAGWRELAGDRQVDATLATLAAVVDAIPATG